MRSSVMLLFLCKIIVAIVLEKIEIYNPIILHSKCLRDLKEKNDVVI